MIRSQNVLFQTSIEDNPSADPPGEELAGRLAAKLRDVGFAVGNIDNWRDCGWSMALSYENGPFQISIASTYEDGWIAQLAPMNQPGVIARLFGAIVTDKSGELFDLALAVHKALIDLGCTDLHWKIDGYPDKTATSEPVQSPS